ncbi:Eco57I restriction-modification methylase domain-containing protein [Paraflavisolibacter sp. H34]|uniref:Eco57I restriction-modification methylase domain-containing protein n=1 Tax=Huijunlia imazamoxiresistens TaxID=3127457 RepID=UPI003018A6BF
MLDTIDRIRREAIKEVDQDKRSMLGQYMTPASVAKFMASLFEDNNIDKPISLLDAGAGVGSLTAAFLDRSLNGYECSKSIKVEAYDIDNTLLQYFKSNIALYQLALQNVDAVLEVELFNVDFIVNAVERIKSNKPKVYTHAILNPPYKKIHSKSAHRLLLQSIDFGTVNLYSAFVALALMLLQEKGQLVTIIPRSFCNGKYYKSFRHFIMQSAVIKRMHLFKARDKAFKDDDVLQENIILHLVKGGEQGNVIVSRSTDESLEDLTECCFLFEQIVKPGDPEAFIHIPHVEVNYLEQSKNISYHLSDIELTVSTGPVVDFRAKDFLYKNPIEGSVPLLYPVHFNGKEIDWPKESKKPNAIAQNGKTQKMLFPSGFYVVVRRFSSKEEKQRIIARVINPHKLQASFIGIENHLNVFHWNKRGIPEEMAYGIAAYLNSSYVDLHFRSFNAHTQVNAADLKQLKYPNREVLMTLGKWAKSLDTFEQNLIDFQIKQFL